MNTRTLIIGIAIGSLMCGGCFGTRAKHRGYARRARLLRTVETVGLTLVAGGLIYTRQELEADDPEERSVSYAGVMTTAIGTMAVLHAEMCDTKWGTYLYGRTAGLERADDQMERTLQYSIVVALACCIGAGQLIGQGNEIDNEPMVVLGLATGLYGYYKMGQFSYYIQARKRFVAAPTPRGLRVGYQMEF